MDKQELETRRLACIRNRFHGQGYSANMIKDLCKAGRRENRAQHTVCRAQHLLLQWSESRNIDVNNSTTATLINFMGDTLPAGYSINTVQVFPLGCLPFLHHSRICDDL